MLWIGIPAQQPRLLEVGHLQLDIDRPVAALAGECLLLWDQAGPGPFIRWCQSSADTVGWNLGGVVAASMASRGLLAVDSAYTLWKFDGPRVTRIRLPVRVPIGVALSGQRWYVVDEVSDTLALLVTGEGSQRVDTLTSIPLLVARARNRGFHINPHNDTVLVTMLTAPFVTYRTVLGQTVVPILRPERASDESLARGDFQLWVSLPILKVTGGILQVLADLTSDFRYLIRYGPGGRQQASALLNAPIGLQLATRDGDVVYGTRDLGKAIEFVRYRWHWPAANNPTQRRE